MNVGLRLRWRLARAYVRLLPPEVKMPTPDRDVLERRIFGALFTDPSIRAIVFAGCAGYTAWYPRLFRFRRAVRFATVDPDPEQASYGARGDHRLASFESLADEPAERGRFDVVVLNGVLGFGIDGPDAQAAAFRAAHVLLRRGGRFLVGYVDLPGATRVDFSLLQPPSWRLVDVPGMGAKRVPTGSKLAHTYVCYEAA